MNVIEVPQQVCGYFTLEAKKLAPDGTVISSRTLAGPFPNIITDQGLDRMGDNGGWMTNCQVGSGNAAPSATDTSLETWVAGVGSIFSNTSSTQTTSSPYYARQVNVYRFGTGAAAGNLSEVGVGWGTSGSTLYSRALILDGGGSPTTITVLSDEVLDVTYEWRVYPPMTDATGSISISGVSYDYTLRAAATSIYKGPGPGWGVASPGGSDSGYSNFGNTAYTGAIGAITGTPSGATGNAPARTDLSYTSSSLYRDVQHVYGLTTVTVSIRSLTFSFGWNSYQIEFDPVIPKTNANQLTLVFRHSWARRTI